MRFAVRFLLCGSLGLKPSLFGGLLALKKGVDGGGGAHARGWSDLWVKREVGVLRFG